MVLSSVVVEISTEVCTCWNMSCNVSLMVWSHYDRHGWRWTILSRFKIQNSKIFQLSVCHSPTLPQDVGSALAFINQSSMQKAGSVCHSLQMIFEMFQNLRGQWQTNPTISMDGWWTEASALWSKQENRWLRARACHFSVVQSIQVRPPHYASGTATKDVFIFLGTIKWDQFSIL